MNTQLNRPLSIAVLQTRNGELPGFEDLYLLTCRNTMEDIRASVSDEETAWNIFREVYRQVWMRKESIPEAGIIRPWIRVLLKEEGRKQGIEIGEFAAETDRNPVKEPDDRMKAALIRIEEELGLFTLPEEITGKKRGGSMPAAVVRLLLSLAGVGAAAAAAVILLSPVGRQAGALKLTAADAPSLQEIRVDAVETDAAPELVYGWNETKQGRRYRDADGSFRESSFLEDGTSLYYMDENGYASTGTRQFGNQSFVFDDSGALKIISRSYGREQNETVLSVQMKKYGREEEAVYIVNDSIILDGGWIYYLYNDGTEGGLPVLLRMKMDSDVTEMIADRVTGYTVQEKNVWYCSDSEVHPFEKGTEALAVGEGWTVEEEDGQWYLKDSYGRNVAGVGGYETIKGRIYRLDEGKITNVRPDTPRIDSYSFRAANAGQSNAVLLGDGSTYLQQGEAIDAVAVMGSTLYYSVLMEGGESPVSRIWCVDVYEGGANPVSGTFAGRVRAMFQFPEADALLLDYRPGASGSQYGKLGIITGRKAYVLDDSDVRKDGFDSGRDQLLPVWTKDDKVLCYWNNMGAAASDGTVRVLDSRTLELDLGNRSALGNGGTAAEASGQEETIPAVGSTVEAVPGGAEESAAELTEDEMVKEAAMTVSPDDVFIGETTPGSGTDEDDEEEEKETSLADGVVEAPAAQETREETVKTETGAGPKPSAAETLHAEPGEIPVPEGPGTVTRPAEETTVAPGPGTGTVAPVPAGP